MNKRLRGGVLWALILVIAVLILAYVVLEVGRIPPADFTRSRLREIEIRVRRYHADKRTLPPNLFALPEQDDANRDTSIVDAWGRPIHYSFTEDGTVILLSLGRDGRRGGTGEDSDVKLVFRLVELVE